MRLHLAPARVRPNESRPRSSTVRRRLSFEGLEGRVVPSTTVAGLHATATVVDAHPAPAAVHAASTHPVVHAAAHKAKAAPAHAAAPKTTAHKAKPAPAHAVKHATTSKPVKVTKPAKVARPATSPAATATTTTTTSTATTPSTATSAPILTVNLNPVDLNLLGLEVKLYGASPASGVTVNVSAQPGSGMLLGNLLSDVSGLLNLQGASNALDTVLGSVITLANESTLSVTGVAAPTGTVTSTTPVLDAYVAPVHLNLLGAVVDTSPIHLQLLAHAGPGLVLGNILVDLGGLLDQPPKGGKLSASYVEQQLNMLLAELNAQLPGIPSAPVAPSPAPAPGSSQLLSLNVPPIDLNLLGLVLNTSDIQVNVAAQSGKGDLLGNLLNDLLNTLNTTPQDLANINTDLNGVLAKVVGVLNVANLTLPAGAVGALSPTLQELTSPTLITPTVPTTPQPVLNLVIANPDGGPPVDVNLLGVVVTTSNIQVQLLALPGDGQILGNLLYNVSHLLDPGGSLGVLSILDTLGL